MKTEDLIQVIETKIAFQKDAAEEFIQKYNIPEGAAVCYAKISAFEEIIELLKRAI